MNYTYRNDLHRELHELLCSEAEKRGQRPGDTWITLERESMLKAVNSHRSSIGKSPIAIEDVERVETMAAGHSANMAPSSRCTAQSSSRSSNDGHGWALQVLSLVPYLPRGFMGHRAEGCAVPKMSRYGMGASRVPGLCPRGQGRSVFAT